MQNLNRTLKEIDQVQNRRITIGASVLFLLFPIFTSPDFNWNLRFLKVIPFQRNFASYVLSLIFFFVHTQRLLPKFYFKKKYLHYAFSLILAFVICTILPQILLKENGNYPSRFMPPRYEDGPRAPMFPTQNAFQFIFAFGASLLLVTQRRLKQAEQQKIEFELSYLKAQINPHFLFNTLNSIYALVLQKSEKAPDVLLKLSHIMRYVLEDDKGKFVRIDKELDFIKNFTALQKLRISHHESITLHIDEQLYSKGLVAPMLFANFVENAFKYGVNPEEEGKIKISFLLEDPLHIAFTCTNTIVSSGTSFQNDSNGIGIENTRQRLDNLYPNNYALSVNATSKSYEVFLKIPIK